MSATRVQESVHITAPVADVWAVVKALDFKYMPTVTRVEIENKASPNEVGCVRKVVYKDGTVQKIKMTELSDARYRIAWDLIESNPSIHVMSATHSIALHRVTQDNSTFMEWTTDFSSDVSSTVLEDQRYKQRDHFLALKNAFTKETKKEKGKEKEEQKKETTKKQ
eukprot:TRINITY_DN8948_c0_g1_i1.p1 TRINITY_DN8948_c0_g1~~TRINITY_DN8948_c0_g1_i1.p1  ORF type:complete len:166 (-),score=54.06 TRINITY_DN8948_c0_g1_i1:196-693(-)